MKKVHFKLIQIENNQRASIRF